MEKIPDERGVNASPLKRLIHFFTDDAPDGSDVAEHPTEPSEGDDFKTKPPSLSQADPVEPELDEFMQKLNHSQSTSPH
ncbi:hypothetical protein IQ250_26940, partial [Pseudanabaenaceae cyanobacterium LEGE 13415]|nr:hypothetical protein [Pseudanabaenaceae cyanobacterium LEGE 13415]